MERSRNPKKQDSVVSSIPQDLITEILARLPPKSIGKLIVVSKLWSSIIRSKYFTDLYMTRSLTRPCVLFTFHRNSTRFFHSVSEELPPKSSSSSSSSTTTTSLVPPSPLYDVSPPIRGLICCQDSSKVMISNPSTGQFVDLPKVRTRRRGISTFLGYDPIKDEYKVLSMTVSQRAHKYKPVVSEEHQVFTLGAQKNKKKKETWRMIECKLPHCPATKGLCENGVVYYGAWSNSHEKGQGSLIVGFDVRLEEFSHIKLPDGVEIQTFDHSELVKYQKNIALVNRAVSYKGKVELWVLEDVETQIWTKIVFEVPGWEALAGNYHFRCRGAISSGEYIFTATLSSYRRPACYIISYDRNENIARRVDIEGIGDRFDSMSVFLDHVESPLFL